MQQNKKRRINKLPKNTNNKHKYYAKYIQKMEEVKLYDTGVKLEESDNTLTLQTCLENDPSAVEIVVCKEIGKDYFN